MGAHGDSAGSAYVYQRNEGGADNWGEVAKITAGDAAFDDGFGRSVAISGDTVIVGAFDDDDNGTDSGSAYVYQRDEGGADNWGEVAKITASDGAAYDVFSWSVSISGDTAIVGAHDYDGDWLNDGSAYVYQRDEGGVDNWGEVTKITASDGSTLDHLGSSAGISGDTAIVGASWDDDNGRDSGSAYIFDSVGCPPDDCDGDANGDGTVDPMDSGFVLARFGCPVGTGDPDCDAADQNGDGIVDPLDNGFVLERFGECP